MVPAESSSEITAHLTTGAAVVYFIEWLKRQGWCPWVTPSSDAVNRLVSLGGAVIAVMGISFTYDPMAGGAIMLPPLSVLAVGAWEVVKQYSLQQVLFDAAIRQKTVVVTHAPIAAITLTDSIDRPK